MKRTIHLTDGSTMSIYPPTAQASFDQQEADYEHQLDAEQNADRYAASYDNHREAQISAKYETI